MFSLLNVHLEAWGGSPKSGPDDVISVGGVMLDRVRRRALVQGHVIHLPRAEAAVLEILMRRAGTNVHRALLREALPFRYADAMLDRLVRRLRRRLTPTPLNTSPIGAGLNHGYRFDAI